MNMSKFLKQELIITRRNQLILIATGLAQLGLAINDIYSEHKSRSTEIGIAHRKWQVAEDNLNLYKKKLIIRYGKKYDMNSNGKYVGLRDEADATFKVYALMIIDKKLGKLGNNESKKKKKLMREREHIQDNY